GGFSLGDRGPHVHSVERLVLAELSTGNAGKGRVHIGHVDHAIDRPRLDLAWPIGKGRYPGAAFEERSLAVAIRTVVSGKRSGHFRISGEHCIDYAAIVALEDDKRVVAHAPLFERRYSVTDLIVHARDHGRVFSPVVIGNVTVEIDIFLRRLEGRVR